MTAALQTLLNKLGAELGPLLESGCNWQVTLHGGRNGNVKLDILRTDELQIDASKLRERPK